MPESAKPSNSTVDNTEIERFSRIAEEWWDEGGKFAPLHRINPLRIQYILEHVSICEDRARDHSAEDKNTASSANISHSSSTLKGKSLLDIGCGGGLIAEPMARLGAHVTAIDASEKNIAVAGLHATQMGLAIDYRCCAVEELPHNVQYDVILALEIIEHVANPALFVQHCMTLLKPGGTIILTTLNRTWKSLALAKIGAEYILRWLPIGTHDWNKFIQPFELAEMVRSNSGEVTDITGMPFNPLTWKWRLDKHEVSVNYLLTARKADA